MPADADAKLADLCRRQFGVFALTQGVEVGVPHATLVSRLRAGRYRSVFPGVFAEAATPESWEGDAMAALLAVGGEAVLARGSAARVLGLDVPDAVLEGLHVLVRTRTFEPLPDVTVHRTRTLDDEDVEEVAPLPCTTTTRTICDLAGVMGPVALRRTLADAIRRDATTATDLRRACRRLGRIRGKRYLLELVDELSPLDGDCRSALETAFLHLMQRAGLPPTAMNHPVVDGFGTRRFIDAAYLPEHLPIELDSRSTHGSLLDWHDDLRRENAIVLTGWRDFLRFSWADVHQRPAEVVTTIRRALDAARTPT